MRKVCFALMTLLLILPAAAPAHADDAALGRIGETVYPIQESEVRMAAEEVLLTVEGGRSRADLTFTFTNDGPARTILMGFPVGSRDPEAWGDAELHDFKTWIDGQPAAVKRETGISPEEPTLRTNGQVLAYPAWITWTVPFGQGQTRIIHNTYWSTTGGWSNGEVMAGYILKTGAFWKGPIGSAVVRVRPGNVLPTEIERVEPANYHWEGDELVWRWQNFEPTRDIAVYWNSRSAVPWLVEGWWPPAGADEAHPQALLAYLQEFRLEHPNTTGHLDDVDLSLARWRYVTGDIKGAALASQASATDDHVPLVAYLAVQAGRKEPADFLGWNLQPPFRRWLQGRAGVAGDPPAAPTLQMTGPQTLTLGLTDPDDDIYDWGVTVWAEPNESLTPLAAFRPGEEPEAGSGFHPLVLPESPLGRAVWATAWVEDSQGHRRETGLVKLEAPSGQESPAPSPAPVESHSERAAGILSLLLIGGLLLTGLVLSRRSTQ